MPYIRILGLPRLVHRHRKLAGHSERRRSGRGGVQIVRERVIETDFYLERSIPRWEQLPRSQHRGVQAMHYRVLASSWNIPHTRLHGGAVAPRAVHAAETRLAVLLGHGELTPPVLLRKAALVLNV